MIFLPSVDLCHRRRDVHGGGHHRLLHIHRFRGLEEDPDRKTVLRTAPLPSSHLIYKCNVASLFAKSNPRSNQLLFWRLYHQDQRSSFGTRSNYQATKAAARLLGVLSGSVCPGDAGALTVTCPPALFPASAGREMSGFDSFGYWKVISRFVIFSMKFTSVFKCVAGVFSDQPQH